MPTVGSPSFRLPSQLRKRIVVQYKWATALDNVGNKAPAHKTSLAEKKATEQITPGAITRLMDFG
jgi:hypothetical protein